MDLEEFMNQNYMFNVSVESFDKLTRLAHLFGKEFTFLEEDFKQ